jgi:hypothetical protein
MCPSSTIYRGLLTTTLAAALASGCSRHSDNYAPEIRAATAGEEAVKQYDADGDGKIAGVELDKASSLKSNLAAIDADGDKALTADEIAARVRSWRTSKTLARRTPLHCKVYHDKVPLADADVRLVPEKFLGDKMAIVRGKTSRNGVAFLTVEGSAPDDPPGVGPGFYRVEITKAGEEIPAKYNTDTILGLDTSMDNPLLLKGVRFDLEYKPPKGRQH